MTFGDELKRARDAAGLTQQGVASKLGVTVQAVSQWETNKSAPEATKLLLVLRLLKMIPEEFTQGSIMTGAEIRAAREAQGWSQAHLGDLAGTNQQTVDRVEKDQIKHCKALPQIVAALHGAEMPSTFDRKRVTPASTEILPEQLPVRIDFFDGGLSIDQTGGPEGDQSVWIAGRANVATLIDALQQALEAME
ncbi:MAG: helix-turn-helix transcriptional regulator [Mesorhizobium sp.]